MNNETSAPQESQNAQIIHISGPIYIPEGQSFSALDQHALRRLATEQDVLVQDPASTDGA